MRGDPEGPRRTAGASGRPTDAGPPARTRPQVRCSMRGRCQRRTYWGPVVDATDPVPTDPGGAPHPKPTFRGSALRSDLDRIRVHGPPVRSKGRRWCGRYELSLWPRSSDQELQRVVAKVSLALSRPTRVERQEVVLKRLLLGAMWI